MKIQKKMKTFEKGSITVEATFIMGLTLFVVFLVLSLCFYMHNRAWYSAAAAETAITAATSGVRINSDPIKTVEDKIKSFSDGTRFPDNGSGLIFEGDEKIMKITTKAEVPIFMTNQFLEIEVDISSEVIKPTKFIRQIQSLQIIKEQIGGN